MRELVAVTDGDRPFVRVGPSQHHALGLAGCSGSEDDYAGQAGILWRARRQGYVQWLQARRARKVG